MNKNTKIVSASVRVMISYNYSNFEGSMTIENPDGLEVSDIDEARKSCQLVATNGVNAYKTDPNMMDIKKEVVKLDKKLEELKQISNIQNNGSTLTRQE